jgi:hypothetical protein
MGVKTTNYESKSTGLVLPVAYAILTNLIVEKDNRVRAIFAIHASREAATTYKAIDKVEVNFLWDRKTDPAKMAYEKAKTEVIVKELYEENILEPLKVTEYGTLYGWEDDIV